MGVGEGLGFRSGCVCVCERVKNYGQHLAVPLTYVSIKVT